MNSTKLLFAALFSILLFGCSSSSTVDAPPKGDASAGDSGAGVTVEFPEGDPSVSAEDGGPGFTGEGWTTSSPGRLGSPNAVRGGVVSRAIPNWPENLRQYGTGSNTTLNSLLASLCYETLCGLHPNTREATPSLASHWQVSEDKMTFRFRINPKAHWSDGKPVVAQDWIKTYQLVNDETLVDPMTKQTICGKMEEPVALSKYMLEVKCKEKSWLNFILIAQGFYPLPAHEIGDMSGKDFLDKYNFAFTANSGPYVVRPQDIKKGESLTISRRNDYWGEDEESTQGLYNFDKIRFVVIRDRRLTFDKVCKGEIDVHEVATAKWWVEDVTPLDAFKNGQLIRKEIFTKFPKSIQGLAFNTRKPPVDDIRVRKAIAHLYDRKTLLTKFAYDQYERLKSFYPGGDYENPDNQMVEYDPEKAVELLTEAGWTERDTDGVLKKNGERLTITVLYRAQAFEKYLTSFQESCKQVGVEVILKLITGETQWKNMMERTYQVSTMAWGASDYPVPSTMWASEMADKDGSNNITGFKSAEADAIIAKYDQEFDHAKRIELLRELDAIIYNSTEYVLAWYMPCERMLYWNKFGMPENGLPRYGQFDDVFVYWWYDPEKAAKLKETLKGNSAMGEIPELQLRPWD